MMTWRLDDKAKRKYETAERLGLIPQLLESGWPGLTAKEAGRIGGSMRRKKPSAALPPNDDRS